MRRAEIAKHKSQIFKPIIDNRFGTEHIQSHDSNRLSSRPVHQANEIIGLVDPDTRVVGIDEAQFFDESVVEVAQKLAYDGIRVIVTGLDMDFKGVPFGPMPTLLAIAEDVTKLSAVCVVCGISASRTQRLIQAAKQHNEAEPQVLVGAKELYEARCRFCHDPEPLK